ncbi:QueT transporter family protein [Mesorhizobium sp. CAU 1732]|uniref:QueT transporter family protein n=1 Tax=Mesorhizobium sp. CAU 1732 TaxID=3140358 RepID=UPI003261ACB3
MTEVFTMWRHTNMIVLTALCAAIYAAVLIPFQSIPIIPGHVSFRIAGVLPIALGLMFGPAGAWGAAIGNLIGDFFGTLSPGAVGGFVSNFMTAFMAYKLWSVLSPANDLDVSLNSFQKLVRFETIAVLKAFGTVVMLTWWVCLLLRLAPPHAYATAVLISNLVAPVIGGPFVLKILQPRIKKWGLLWTDIMKPEEVSAGFMPKLGLIFLVIGSLGGGAALFWSLFMSGLNVGDPIVRFLPLPFIILQILGAIMIGARNQIEAAQHEDRLAANAAPAMPRPNSA